MEYVYSNKKIVGSRKYKKVNKLKKVMRNIIILSILIILISMSFSIILGKDELTTKKIVVGHGDTLWNIASKICNKSEGLNVQNVIIEIKKLNSLKSSIIYEGQELFVYNH